MNNKNYTENRFSFYIKMSKINYLKNIVLSTLLSFVLTYLFSKKESNILLLLVFWGISFFMAYRVGEYLLSKKFIYYLVGGHPATGREALIDFIIFIIIFLGLGVIFLGR